MIRSRASATAGVQIVVTESLSDYARVWPTLDDAHLTYAYAFQCRDLLEVWLATIGKARGICPLFVRVTDGYGQPVMLLPLGLEKIHGIRRLVFLDGGVADYNAPVLFPGSAALDATIMRPLWKEIVATLPVFDVAVFTKMPRLVGTMPNPMTCLDVHSDREPAYLLDLTLPCTTLKGKARKGIALFSDTPRYRRRLEERGQVALEIAETPEQCVRFLNAMKRQKRRRYIETRGVDGFTRPGFLDYYDMMTTRFGTSGKVSLSALVVDDHPIAVHWGIATTGHFYYLMPSFEAGEWAKYAPGRLMLENLIDWCRAQGFNFFDMGVGEHAYKQQVGGVIVPLVQFEHAETLVGHAYLASQAIRKNLSDGPLGDRWRALKLAWGQRNGDAASGQEQD